MKNKFINETVLFAEVCSVFNDAKTVLGACEPEEWTAGCAHLADVLRALAFALGVSADNPDLYTTLKTLEKNS